MLMVPRPLKVSPRMAINRPRLPNNLPVQPMPKLLLKIDLRLVCRSLPTGEYVFSAHRERRNARPEGSAVPAGQAPRQAIALTESLVDHRRSRHNRRLGLCGQRYTFREANDHQFKASIRETNPFQDGCIDCLSAGRGSYGVVMKQMRVQTSIEWQNRVSIGKPQNPGSKLNTLRRGQSSYSLTSSEAPAHPGRGTGESTTDGLAHLYAFSVLIPTSAAQAAVLPRHWPVVLASFGRAWQGAGSGPGRHRLRGTPRDYQAETAHSPSVMSWKCSARVHRGSQFRTEQAARLDTQVRARRRRGRLSVSLLETCSPYCRRASKELNQN